MEPRGNTFSTKRRESDRKPTLALSTDVGCGTQKTSGDASIIEFFHRSDIPVEEFDYRYLTGSLTINIVNELTITLHFFH